jgi:hypothetical protein
LITIRELFSERLRAEFKSGFLNSTSNRFPRGLGNDNGLLGKYVCFQNYRGSIRGDAEGFEDKYYYEEERQSV